MTLARRTISSTGWNLIANAITFAILFVRSILLARWLPVETFGVFAFADAVINISVVVANFGLGPAFLHRAPETEDTEGTAAIHFTLKLILTSIWLVVMLLASMLAATGPVRTALLLLSVTTFGIQLAQTPQLILTRRVVHRRLALISLTNTMLGTLVTLFLAASGATLWALLAGPLVNLGLTVTLLYFWRPVWRPRLSWSSSVVSYYLRFGSRTFLVGALSTTLQRLDDLWTGRVLGSDQLGLYSRAYRFASFPSMLLATPISNVVSGTYAELKGQRLRLSRAFFNVTAFLVRTGFYLGGLFALVAPEFIRLAIGPKWIPMLGAYRLMLIFALLDPLRANLVNLLTVMGAPGEVLRAQLIQLAVMVLGILTLGSRYGIAGVAMSVNVMLFLGIGIWLWRVRVYVDYSVWRLFGVPILAISVSLLSARSLIRYTSLFESDWETGGAKALSFTFLYFTILVLLERSQIAKLLLAVGRLDTTIGHVPGKERV